MTFELLDNEAAHQLKDEFAIAKLLPRLISMSVSAGSNVFVSKNVQS